MSLLGMVNVINMKVKIHGLQFRLAGSNVINNISFQEITNSIIFWNPIVFIKELECFQHSVFHTFIWQKTFYFAIYLQEIKLRCLKCPFEDNQILLKNLKPWTQKFTSVLALDLWLKTAFALLYKCTCLVNKIRQTFFI